MLAISLWHEKEKWKVNILDKKNCWDLGKLYTDFELPYLTSYNTVNVIKKVHRPRSTHSLHTRTRAHAHTRHAHSHQRRQTPRTRVFAVFRLDRARYFLYTNIYYVSDMYLKENFKNNFILADPTAGHNFYLFYFNNLTEIISRFTWDTYYIPTMKQLIVLNKMTDIRPWWSYRGSYVKFIRLLVTEP